MGNICEIMVFIHQTTSSTGQQSWEKANKWCEPDTYLAYGRESFQAVVQGGGPHTAQWSLWIQETVKKLKEAKVARSLQDRLWKNGDLGSQTGESCVERVSEMWKGSPHVFNWVLFSAGMQTNFLQQEKKRKHWKASGGTVPVII